MTTRSLYNTNKHVIIIRNTPNDVLERFSETCAFLEQNVNIRVHEIHDLEQIWSQIEANPIVCLRFKLQTLRRFFSEAIEDFNLIPKIYAASIKTV